MPYGDEVRDPYDYFGKIGEGEIDPKLMNLVVALIDERSKRWSPDMVSDPVQARLLEIIAAKKKGGKRPAKAKTELEAAPSNVINIMEALRKSISSDGEPAKGG
jgi:DNA end-binding protein Ku